MELLERYLQAVKFWLPSRQSNDIVAELSADIYAQVEDREAALGRQLTTPEVEALLKQRGRPFLVANRFLPQRSLIGPALFPIYRFVMKVVFFCYLVPWLLMSLAIAFSGSIAPAARPTPAGPVWLGAVAQLSSRMIPTAFIALAVVTLVFALIERLHERSNFLDKWNPSQLPPLRNPNQIPRAASTFEMAVNWVFFIWWATHMNATQFSIGSSIHIAVSPQWSWFYWSYFILALANATLAAANLMRPYWTPLRATLRLLTDATGAIIFCWLLKANLLVGIAIATVPQDKSLLITQAINLWMPRIFPLAIALTLLIVGIDIYRILRLQPSTDPPTA